MTDEDREEAERLAQKYAQDYITFDEFKVEPFIAGYAAACEAKRAEVDRANALQQDDETHRWALFEKLEAERARSAKLIEALRFYSTEEESKVKGQIEWNPHVCDSFSGLNYAPDWDGNLQDEPGEIARKAIAEYEGK